MAHLLDVPRDYCESVGLVVGRGVGLLVKLLVGSVVGLDVESQSVPMWA